MRVWSAVITTLVFAALSLPSATAQILYGGLVGNVTDSSDAAIPGAKVTISHAATGTTRAPTATRSGIYRFPTLPPGTYTVSVQANGFRVFSQSGAEVNANSLTRIDARLDVGEVTERVTVETSAVTLQ